jgi:hypothetical protein
MSQQVISPKPKRQANKLSDFWIVDKFDTSKSKTLLADKSIANYMKLAALRRSISDFVKIVTKKNIPVEYITKNDMSFTDGKKVFISAKIDEGNIDSTVGLALHEGAHIKLTDFKLLEILEHSITKDIFDKCKKKGLTKTIVLDVVKELLNWVEDRRIDHYIFTTTPGYRGYYHALYDRYFYSEIVTKGLQSNQYRTEELESYLYRVFNIINPATDLDALNALRQISEKIDLKHIDRLKNTTQALTVAIELLEIIVDTIDKIDPSKYEQDDADGEGDDDGDGDDDKKSDGNGKGKKKRKIKYDPTGKKSNGNGKGLYDLTKEELKDLLEEIEKQKDFLNGQIEKFRLSGDDLKKINQIGDAGTELKNVKVRNNSNQTRMYDSVYNLGEYKVVVIKKVTEEMFNSGVLAFASDDNSHNENEQAVIDGIRLGKQLGRKLQIRNEERLTQYTRKDTGRIDKRLLAELGFGNSSVFQQTFIETYTNAILHMSIDISGSMSGIKLSNAIKMVTAICQAASMTDGNLDAVVDVRSTDHMGDPFVAIVYDSRVDKMHKIKKLFPRIEACGTTPEGLCFAAIQDLIEGASTKLRSYFINLSDGEPYFEGYSGTLAAEHTRGEVHKMRERGIKVLSYFITHDGYEHQAQFQQMYGQSAAYVNADSLMDIARTLNKMFVTEK